MEGFNMDDAEAEDLHRLEEALGYRFKDDSLLHVALCHSSFVNENKERNLPDNERMEFLGDAVIQLAASEMLYWRFTGHDEGKLSKLRSFLVTEHSLAEVARGCSLGGFILLGKGEDLHGGRDKESILSNTLEAVIGAVFIDGGYDKARQLVKRLFSPLLESIEETVLDHDRKSRLQERSHELFRELPSYRVTNVSGPDHDRTFQVEVQISNVLIAQGSGKSKKEAEQQAAGAALATLEAITAEREP